MPFPVPFLPMVLTAAFASAIFMWFFNFSTSAKIRETHTHFAFKQILERLDQIDAADFPHTTNDLINALRSSKIDWNSCGIHGERIMDGWGRPITITFDEKEERWSFRSLGKDGKGGTADDIESATTRKRIGLNAGLED